MLPPRGRALHGHTGAWARVTGSGRSLLARRLCGPEAAAPPALSCSLVSPQPLPLPRERGTPPGMPAESGRGCWTQRPRSGSRGGAKARSPATCSHGGGAACRLAGGQPGAGCLSPRPQLRAHRARSPSQLPVDAGQVESCRARRSTPSVAAGHPSGQQDSGALWPRGAPTHSGW